MNFAVHFSKMWWAYVVIFAMVCLSAYFSASEIAFNSANKMRLRRAAENGITVLSTDMAQFDAAVALAKAGGIEL